MAEIRLFKDADALEAALEALRKNSITAEASFEEASMVARERFIFMQLEVHRFLAWLTDGEIIERERAQVVLRQARQLADDARWTLFEVAVRQRISRSDLVRAMNLAGGMSDKQWNGACRIFKAYHLRRLITPATFAASLS